MVESRPADASDNSREPESTNKKKLKTTGGRSKGVRSSSDTTCNITKFLIVLVTILILTAAAVAVALYIVMDQASSSLRYFEKTACDEEEPTPMHINSCLNSGCMFDLSTCVEPCPFGYRTDESGCEDSCECAVEGNYEGDIAFSEDELHTLTELYGYALPTDFAVFSGSSTSSQIWNENPVRGRHRIAYELTSSVKRLGNFKKRLKSQVRDLDSEYDINSVMHYPSNAFSKNKKPTILNRKNDNLVRAQRRGFTTEDLYEVNLLYNCYRELEKAAKWTPWTSWSACDETCGFGERSRFRKCQNDKEEIVEGCKGSKFQKTACRGPTCPALTGRWSEWGVFTECSAECSGGFQWRRRSCTPYNQCKGVSYQGKSCNTEVCEGMPRWADWSAWSTCSKRCGGGYMKRKRQCLTVDFVPALTCEGEYGVGTETQNQDCNTQDCSAWSAESDFENLWSSCSSSCDGTRTRERVCEDVCQPGQDIETEPCNVDACDRPRPDMFLTDVVEIPQILCNPSVANKWYFGDYNGDDRTDSLCASLEGFFKLGHSNQDGVPEKLNWQGTMKDCKGWFRYIADFNGDGRDDIICRDVPAKTLYIKLSNRQGQFDTLGVNAGNFCTGRNDKFHIVDVNGDGKADLVCHYDNINIEIRLNRGF